MSDDFEEVLKRLDDEICDLDEKIAEKDAEIARLKAAYHSETLLSNALAGALRERGYEHVWDAGTQRLTVTAVLGVLRDDVSLTGPDLIVAAEAWLEAQSTDEPAAK